MPMTTLYDAAQGGLPEALLLRTSPGAQATARFDGEATVLDTTASRLDIAGYVAPPQALSALSRADGLTLTFTVQLLAEAHEWSDKNNDGVGDRAGFSVLLLAEDARGIELGFWEDEIWAQQDGPLEPPAGTLFTRAESARFNTAAALQRYTLALHGDRYRLAADGAPILEGRLRDYAAFEGPVNPYRTPYVLFLGDDTGSAQAIVRIAHVAIGPGVAS